MKLKYIPLIDEFSFFLYHRGLQYKKNRVLKNVNIHSSVRVGDYCKIDKNVEIGKGTYMGDFCHIFAGENSKVSIGKYCAIGNNVHLKARTHDLKRPTPTEKHDQNIRKEKDITVGDYVWIGDNVFIKEGIKIGTHAVIAANSVVTADVKVKEIVGGVPARLIKLNNDLQDDEYHL